MYFLWPRVEVSNFLPLSREVYMKTILDLVGAALGLLASVINLYLALKASK
jgi:hypothetical protein